MQLMYPWFLLGLFAIGVPLAIHLLQLRKPKRIPFTNTAIIREVELISVRYRQLQHFLVLLLRVLAVGALVLAFCQPFIPAKDEGTLSRANVTDILVDNSFSMQQGGATGNNLLVEAKGQARELGENTGGGAGRYRLLDAGNAAMSIPLYLAKLDKLQFAALPPKLVGNGGQDGGNGSLYIVSDFQKSAVNTKLLTEGVGNRQVVLVPLTGKKAANVYVDSVWLDDAFVRVRTNLGLRVRVRNGGQTDARECPIKIFLGPRQVAAFRVTVGTGKAATTVVQVQVSDAALALGRVVSEDAPVTFDNAYYFTLKPASVIRILEIGEMPLTQSVYANEPLFSYSFAKSERVDYAALRRANLVLIREMPTVDAGLRDGLRAVLKRGGSVVIVPSASVTAQNSYQQLFQELGLGTAQWEKVTSKPELRDVAMPSVREPFFRDVFGAQQRAVTMPRVAPVLRWARTGQDILRLRDGESYLAAFASGNGQAYVFSAPFTRNYADFADHALFVPVMYRLAMLSYRDEQLPAYRLNQGSVTLQLPVEAASTDGGRADEAGLRFVKDSLSLMPAQRITGPDVRLDVPTGMDSPGFYQVQRRGKVVTTLAFNMNKQESELAAYSADDLRALIGTNHPNIRVVESGANGAGLTALQAEQTGQPLWRYFLAAALLCLLAEAAVLRFGRQVSRPAARPGMAA